MVKDSLDKFLNKFPYFLNKNEGSNFYNVSYVNNEIFKDLYNDIFDVYQSFSLRKKLLIWKDQVEPYNYKINFVANYPNLKEVKVYKNDDLIYRESYIYDDFVDSFYYTYICNYDTDFVMTDNSLNLGDNRIDDEDILEEANEETKNIPIIPADKFKIIVETYNEYIIVKGFPENDELKNDEFDHDYSLDEFGELNNIPRKNYIDVNDIALYPLTEPPFNNCETEDDYHYMNRILEYNKRLLNTPAPVLEIWKLYGLDAVMLNRERLLLKLFDVDKHSDEKGRFEDWQPEKWEHKDKFCDYDINLGKYFFVEVDNIAPTIYTNLNVKFLLYNSLAERVYDDFTVKIEHYIQGDEDNVTIVADKVNSKDVNISYKVFDKDNVNVLRFTVEDNDTIKNDIVECIINIRDENDGDWYVDELNGDDVINDGTEAKPFKTLEKAISVVNKALDLIVIKGNITIDTEDDIPIVNTNCTILGCDDTQIFSNVDRRFFKINGMKNIKLNLVNLTLSNNELSVNFKTKTFINKNEDYNNFEIVLIHGGSVELDVSLDKNEYFPFDYINVLGNLKTSKNVPLSNKDIDIYFDEVSEDTYFNKIITKNEGMIDSWVNLNLPCDATDCKLLFDFDNMNFFRKIEEVDFDVKHIDKVGVIYGNSCTLTSNGYDSNQEVVFYNTDRDAVGTVNADGQGKVSFEYTPELGDHIIYTFKNNLSECKNVFDEWYISPYKNISDLNNDTFVTGLEIVDDSVIVVTVKTISKLRDLDGIIIDFNITDEDIILTRYDLPFDEYTEDELEDVKLTLKELDIIETGINIIDFINDTGEFEIICEN